MLVAGRDLSGRPGLVEREAIDEVAAFLGMMHAQQTYAVGANPMSVADIVGKFDENAADILAPDARRRLVDAVMALPASADAVRIVDLTLGAGAAAC